MLYCKNIQYSFIYLPNFNKMLCNYISMPIYYCTCIWNIKSTYLFVILKINLIDYKSKSRAMKKSTKKHKMLVERVREVLRQKHYSIRTEGKFSIISWGNCHLCTAGLPIRLFGNDIRRVGNDTRRRVFASKYNPLYPPFLRGNEKRKPLC